MSIIITTIVANCEAKQPARLKKNRHRDASPTLDYSNSNAQRTQSRTGIYFMLGMQAIDMGESSAPHMQALTHVSPETR